MKTDWNQYYSSAAFFSRFTRGRLVHHLEAMLKPHLAPTGASITELGGGNSVLLNLFMKFRPSSYVVIDNNDLGLELFEQKTKHLSWARASQQDLLASPVLPPPADCAVSVGLIEHFSLSERERLVDLHLKAVKEGGVILITFPTPTWLYRFSRKMIEMLGQWKFHDEVPLKKDDVAALFANRGVILEARVIWSQILTQQVLILRKTTPEKNPA